MSNWYGSPSFEKKKSIFLLLVLLTSLFSPIVIQAYIETLSIFMKFILKNDPFELYAIVSRNMIVWWLYGNPYAALSFYFSLFFVERQKCYL